MTFLSTEVQHPSKECESLFYISLFHEKATLERELPRGGNIYEWS